jgi:lipopolysaccharide biosynthesis protein
LLAGDAMQPGPAPVIPATVPLPAEEHGAANDAAQLRANGWTSTPLRVISDPGDRGDLRGERVCVFVSYAPDYQIKPHVRLHLAALKRSGFQIIHVMVVDGMTARAVPAEPELMRGLVVRENGGYDFGAWADAFRTFPALWQAAAVLLVNDSVFGPFGDFDRLMARALKTPADLVGLTESAEITPHFQSYFLLLKGNALSHPGARAFWREIVNLPSKRATILAYEVPLVERFRRLGLTCTALFPWRGPTEAPWDNPTHHHWRRLLALGFPYIKVELLRDNPARIDIRGWRRAIGDRAHLRVIEATLARAGALRSAGYAEARRRPSTSFPQAVHSLVHRVMHSFRHRPARYGDR